MKRPTFLKRSPCFDQIVSFLHLKASDAKFDSFIVVDQPMPDIPVPLVPIPSSGLPEHSSTPKPEESKASKVRRFWVNSDPKVPSSLTNPRRIKMRIL